VNGRRTLTFEQRLQLDIWYVDHRSMRVDLEIIRRTITTVLSGEGAEPARHRTPDMGWTREAEAARMAEAARADAFEGSRAEPSAAIASRSVDEPHLDRGPERPSVPPAVGGSPPPS
jgi:hypothetical protein